MSDANEKSNKPEVIEDAVIVEETPDTVVVEETVVERHDEPVPTDTAAPAPQVIYVQTPVAPANKGNRGVGALIALASGILFTAVLALITALAGFIVTGRFSFGFLTDATFYIPTLFFVIGFVLLVLLANRANWWAYIFGSIIVGVLVYFGTIGLGLLADGIILATPGEAEARYVQQLSNPFILIAALLARETSLWMGSVIARRGRKLKVRNAEAREAWQREMAEKRAEHERTASGASTAV